MWRSNINRTTGPHCLTHSKAGACSLFWSLQGPSYDQAVGSRLKVWLIQPQVSTELLSDSGLSQGSSPCLNVVVINKNSELEGLLNIDLPADQTR
jgi:hypothetical protein